MKVFKKLYLFAATVLLLQRVLVSPRPVSPQAATDHLIRELEHRARVTETYSSYIFEAASEWHVDPRVIVAILTVEDWNRPELRRDIKDRIAETSVLTATWIGTPPANLSIGVGQIKLKTAVWISENFPDIQHSRKALMALDIPTIKRFSEPKQNIRLAATYLAYLGARRYGKSADLMSNPERLKIIATEYHRGMKALDVRQIDKYGEIVAQLACSRSVEDLVANAASK